MRTGGKSAQLQIRVSKSQKDALRRHARRAGVTMSEWVLSRLLPPPRSALRGILEALSVAQRPRYVLAELNELLTGLTISEFELAVSEPPQVRLDPYLESYVAAMIEQAAAMKNTGAPAWTRDVLPLDEPVFGSSLKSLRLHLLTRSPLPFRRRNIFIDSSIGDRV